MTLNEYYAYFITQLWEGTISGNEPYNVNAEVQEICDKVFQQIQTCSRQMIIPELMTKLFLGKRSLSEVYDAMKDLATDESQLRKWFDVLLGSKQYQTCVLTARLNWRTKVQLALMGL